jgi:hypothetical protein
MKKLYSFLLLASCFSYAQTVVFDQPITGTNGIVSTVLSTGNAVYSADDFSVAEATKLTKLTVRGFQNQGDFLTLYQGLRMVVYTNSATNTPSGIPGGTPGTIIAELDITGLNPSVNIFQDEEGGEVTIEIDFLTAFTSDIIVQPATTYWLTIAPKMNLTAYTGATRFNWYTGTGATGTNYPGQLVDPANAFGANATNWTNIATLTNNVAFNNLSFTFEGDTNLSIDSQELNVINAYPNPASDVVTITPGNNSFENLSFQVYDLNGRKVIETKDSTINVQNLNSGVYMVHVFSDKTKIGIQKIVKK